MRDVTVKVHAIAEDGLPSGGDNAGRIALIFDGCIVSGWPLSQDEEGVRLWEADSDVGRTDAFYGVTHWVEFPEPIWELESSPTEER